MLGVFWNPQDLLLMMGTEIFQIDASWAEKLMKTRGLKILSPTVRSRPRGVALMRRPTVSSSPLMNIWQCFYNLYTELHRTCWPRTQSCAATLYSPVMSFTSSPPASCLLSPAVMMNLSQGFMSLLREGLKCVEISISNGLKRLKIGFKCKSWTSLPYFRVKLSCVCLMFAYRKKSNDL